MICFREWFQQQKHQKARKNEYDVEVILQYEENALASQLKQICYANGREKYPTQSAIILHKLGKIYRKRSPDKISLIQSSALFNSAIIRQPKCTEEIENDLKLLCTHILKVSKAQNLNYDLVDAAKRAKHDIENMRERLDLRLETLELISWSTSGKKLMKMEKQKISEVRKLEIDITDEYSTVMKGISRSCVEAMGEPPCKFALLGMGSLVRKEITPYSDFECAIVLDEVQYKHKYDRYQNILTYFRGFALVFQIILVNLQETLLRFLNIPSLNDAIDPVKDWFYDGFTPCGISPDGFSPKSCKNPLGRQKPTARKPWTTELIKPVSEMIKYLESEEALKNGYYLADILSKTCFVSGDVEIYYLFGEKVISKLLGLKNQLEEEATTGNTALMAFKNLTEFFDGKSGNIKQVIYRSITFYISVLGKIIGINEASCFEIIEQLRKRRLLSSEDEHKLLYALAIACEIRLKLYSKHRGQIDWIQHDFQNETEFIGTVGEKSLMDCFKTLLQFQDAFKSIDFNNLKTLKLSNFSNFFAETTVCYYFRFNKECISLCEAKLQDKENCDRETIMHCHHYIGLCLKAKKEYQRANDHFELALAAGRIGPDEDNKNRDVAESLFHGGICLMELNKGKAALERFRNHHQFLLKIPTMKLDSHITLGYTPALPKLTEYIADTVQCIGHMFMRLGEPLNAIKYFQKGLRLATCLYASNRNSKHLSRVLAKNNVDLGRCLRELKRHKEARDVLESALEIFKRISPDEFVDEYVLSAKDDMNKLKMG